MGTSIAVAFAVLAGLAGIRAAQFWSRENLIPARLPLRSPQERLRQPPDDSASRPIGAAMFWTMLSTVFAALATVTGPLLALTHL